MRWVAMTLVLSSSVLSAEDAGPWAYASLSMWPVPDVRRTDWPRGEIDRFVLARLEAAGLAAAPDADRATLARRLTFALHGLPPTPEQVDALVNDGASEPVERFVDRLLASPRFGEHWARHWLDAVRFGQSLTLRGFVFEEAWRYRDYVIDAFNRDLPYDRFVREQIAGDLIPHADLVDRQRALVATTFLALGNTNLEEQNKRLLEMDVVDEQLDTLGKVFFGQALGCARCHDHKFDPIPMRDYYALAGILKSSRQLEHANVSKWLERPLPLEPAEEARLDGHERQVAALEAAIKHARELAEAAGSSSRGNIVQASQLPGVVVDSTSARPVGAWTSSTHFPRYVGDGYLHDDRQAKGEKTLTFEPTRLPPGEYEVRLAYIPGGARDRATPVTVFHAQGETEVRVDQEAEPPIAGRWVSLGRYRFETDGFSHVLVSNAGTTGYVTADAVQFLPVGDGAAGDVPALPAGPRPEASDDALKSLEAKLRELKATGPRRPMVMTLLETGRPVDLPLHRRGNVDSLGDPVPRGVLSVITQVPVPVMPGDQSGRLQLADWAVHPDHPLTSRVMVNRLWQWLFGEGLVRTPDNFGTTGAAPTHPELLDFLASRFRERGWSVKQAVREMVLSRTWQLQSVAPPASQFADPSNGLWSHARPHRLRAEEWRDAMMAAAGRLAEEMGGANHPAGLSSDFGYADTSSRRSIYIPAFRNARPELFDAFDAASPSLVTGRREESTVATQALLLLNSPWVRDQAAATAHRIAAPESPDPATTLDAIYRVVLARLPSDGERQLALAHLGAHPGAEDWAGVVQSLWASIDFRFVR